MSTLHNVLPWQQTVWDNFSQQLGRLPHALLLSGPQGIGKFIFAKDIARALLCESPASNGWACGTCGACRWYEEGNHPDFRLITPESEMSPEELIGKKALSHAIKIEQIRELGAFVGLSSHRGGLRVIIIHPAEAMNAAAANALLKSLEEPPSGVVFILVSGQTKSLLPTIRSRCQIITLNSPSQPQALAWLEAQGVQNCEVLLAQAGNAPIKALGMYQEDYLTARREFLHELCAPSYLKFLNLAERGAKLRLLWILYWLQTWAYDLLSLKSNHGVRYHADFKEELDIVANRVDTRKLLHYQSQLTSAQSLVTHPLNVQLVLEEVLMAYLDVFKKELAYG